MQKNLEKFALFLNKHYGITPNFLTYIRIFSAPWLALLIAEVISNKDSSLAIFTLSVYALVMSTDVLDGILARLIVGEKKHDSSRGGMLDRISDKIFIIFLLIPFGLNLFTFLIILAESMLAFQAIHSPSHKKQATRAGKIKMVLQTLLIPVLVLEATTYSIGDMVVYAYIIFTIIATYVSVYSHYFDS